MITLMPYWSSAWSTFLSFPIAIPLFDNKFGVVLKKKKNPTVNFGT